MKTLGQLLLRRLSRKPKGQTDKGRTPASQKKKKRSSKKIQLSVPSPQAQTALTLVPAFRTQQEQSSQTLVTGDLIRPHDDLKKCIEAFLCDQRSPHTRKAYGKDLKRFVRFLRMRQHAFGLEQLTRSIVIAYKEYLLADGLQDTSVDRHLATLKSFFSWLVDDGILMKSPADGVRFLNPKRLSTTNGFTDEEVVRVLQAPNLHARSGAMHYAILMVLFYCGLRRSEVTQLRVSSIGLEKGKHHVLRVRGKGNQERMLVLLPTVYHAICYYLTLSRRTPKPDEFLFAPIRNNRTKVLAKGIDPSMVFYIVTKYAKKAGIQTRVSPHSCRATAISNARDHHVPDRAIQEFAGWASPDMITHYDKRRTLIENAAAWSILYGRNERDLPTIREESDTPA